MSDLVNCNNEKATAADNAKLSGNEPADSSNENAAPSNAMIDISKPLKVIYCPNCTMPPEFCEFGADFEKCKPWILNNCPGVLGISATDAAAVKLGEFTLNDEENCVRINSRLL